jgi:hypothetical protein
MARFRAPHGAELNLARLRGPRGLLARPSRQLLGAQRDAGSIHAGIESAGKGMVGGLPVLAFGGGDLGSQVFRRSFHLLGVDGHSLGDNARHRLAVDGMGQRVARSVIGRSALGTMTRGLATRAKPLDQRPRTPITNGDQPRLQRVTLELQDFDLRGVRPGGSPT